MWKELADNSGVVLGLAISLYTLYAVVEGRILRGRERYALLRNVHEEFNYFLALSSALANRAGQARTLFAAHLTGSYPPPAADHDSLPVEAAALGQWLVSRANHLIQYSLPLDVEKLGSALNRPQAEALFDLLASRRRYVQVLATRTLDLQAFPRRPGVLARFVGVAHINVDDFKQKLNAFAKSLGLAAPELPVASTQEEGGD